MLLFFCLNSVFEKMEESGIERPEHLLISNGELNPMSMGVVMATAAVGINKLTDKNHKEFHQRLKKLGLKIMTQTRPEIIAERKLEDDD